jgi:Ca-activated chloride channel homolog
MTMTLSARTDRRFVRPRGNSLRYVLVTIDAPTRERTTERPALNVAFVLDRSGSMGGQKIALAREAVVRAIGGLDERDRFSVVAYDDVIDVVIESTPGSREAKRNAMDRLRTIDARGSTNLAEGWLRGAEQVALHQASDAINRCLLLTDGLANIGLTDADALRAHAVELRARGIGTTTFGVGADFDERLLQSLADAGGGHFYFIERAVQIPDFMTSELGELLEVVARDVALDVQLAPGFRLETLSPLALDRRDGGCRLSVGDLVSGQEVEIAVSLRFPAGEIGRTVSAFFTMSDRDGTLSGEGGCSVSWEYAADAVVDTQLRDRSVDRAVARLYAAQAEQEALRLNAIGEFTQAQRRLAGVAERIRGYAGDDTELVALAEGLDASRVAFSAPMAAMDSKRRFAASHNMTRSRDLRGRAQRR